MLSLDTTGIQSPEAPGSLALAAELQLPACLPVHCLTCARGVQGDKQYAALLFTYGLQQINYMLGDSGRSFVVGFGENAPQRPFHKWYSPCQDLPRICLDLQPARLQRGWLAGINSRCQLAGSCWLE